MHFPCGAAAEVELTVEQQCQLYYTAVNYNLEQLDMDRCHFFLPVHIEWRSQTAPGGYFEELYIFKKTAWLEYCEAKGISPTLDVKKFNLKFFDQTASEFV